MVYGLALQNVYFCLSGCVYPSVMEELAPKCQLLCVTGGPKDSKQAIRCLFHNIPDVDNNKYKESVFSKMVEVRMLSCCCTKCWCDIIFSCRKWSPTLCQDIPITSRLSWLLVIWHTTCPVCYQSLSRTPSLARYISES